MTPEKIKSTVLKKINHMINTPNESMRSFLVENHSSGCKSLKSAEKSDIKMTPDKRMAISSSYSVCSGHCELYCNEESPESQD